MAVGRISGPLLKDNLIRNGVNLAFETNLLYLDVVNSRVGINTATPTNDLSVNGTTRTTNLYISNTAQLGLITLSGSTISSNNSTISFSPQGPNPTVYQGTALVGNLSLTGNILSSTNTNGDINFTANGSGSINLNNNVLVTGNIHATGNITADGNITLGNAPTDTVTFDAEIASSIIPNTNNTYNLGSPSLQWATVYANNITSTSTTVGNVNISGNTITTTSGNLNLTANGSGSVQIQNIGINNNVISSVGTNANIVLTPQGTGSVIFNGASFIVPVGTTAQRPSPASNGMIRYNTDLARYEGYTGTGSIWAVLGGVSSIDGKTRITPENTPGAGDNVIRFYANNTLTAYLDSSKLFVNDFQTNSLDISNNTISALSANTDINFTTTGTGGVVFGNLKFTTNTITNISANAITQFVQTGSGYVSIPGTYGVVIPVGTSGNRPPTLYTEAGMVRFNADLQYVEVYNGSAWTNIAGASTGVTSATAQDIGVETALALG
jgi:hypothetical protein